MRLFKSVAKAAVGFTYSFLAKTAFLSTGAVGQEEQKQGHGDNDGGPPLMLILIAVLGAMAAMKVCMDRNNARNNDDQNAYAPAP